jgi:hypothetical protein
MSRSTRTLRSLVASRLKVDAPKWAGTAPACSAKKRPLRPENKPPAAKAPGETAGQAVRSARHQPLGPRRHDDRQEGCRGATDGNHGESTGTGGSPRQRLAHGGQAGPETATPATGLRAIPET